MLINIQITLHATAFNSKYPKVRIFNNNVLLDDIECTLPILTLTYSVESEQTNTLMIEFYNKSFGDNHIWDSNQSEELKVKVLDIKFNDVSINHLISSMFFTTNWTPRQLELQPADFLERYSRFISDGIMVFNGYLEFVWELPIYKFLIEQKFKKSFDSSVAYYSNASELFHYDQGIQFLKEIKELINKHD
jgi:hypothetical protein